MARPTENNVLAPPRVLVVDDDDSTRETLGQALADEGYAVETAGSGNEAWAHCLHRQPDAVISDVRMRNGDGVTLLEKIRVRDANSPVFILISGFSDISPARALAKGAHAYFDKPCWLADILDALEQHL